MTRRGRSSDLERGSATIWGLLLTAGAFTMLFGLILDGGNAVDARIDAGRVAGQAARLGADQLSQASVRNGDDDVAARAARARANGYMRAAHMHGSVHIRGDTVTVTVEGISRTRILDVIGINAFSVHETKSATGLSGEQP